MNSRSDLQEALTHCIAQRLTFAAFRRPGQGQVTLWAQQTPELDRVEPGLLWEMNDVFLIAPFREEKRIPLIRSDVELTFGDAAPAWHRLLECAGSANELAEERRLETSRHQFESAVDQARKACSLGELEKVVLSRTVLIGTNKADAPLLFTTAVLERTEAFVAICYTPEYGLWLGASPERLVLAENDTVRMDALAATRPRSSAPEDAMQWTEKERHEQGVVTKGITATLIDIGARTILIEGPDVLLTAGLAHLHTRISAALEGRSIEDLVTQLHPTPAVCGIPKEIARSHIHAWEDRERELYAGYWGPWSADGRMELFVNIRCMRLFSDRAELHVGAGITSGSNPVLEWEETEHKADGWRSLLQPTAV